MLNNRKKASLLASTVILGSLVATPVYAQEEAGASEDGAIFVTGTRIQRRNVDTAAPVAVVADEEFSLSGTVNVENVVNTLPQVVPGFTSNSNNPGTGTATLNLRGLGSTRTMVLVNGRRWMFYDTSQVVDLNTIPSFLLDSVDVVTGGASAVYGSDALAGVVNFRLRDVDGLEMGAQYSITDENDGDRYELYGAIGGEFAEGRGHVTVYGEYYNREAIFQGDRDFSFFALGDGANGLVPGGSSTPPELRINTPGSQTVAGVSYPLASGLVIDDAFFTAPGVARSRVGTDLYNYAPANYLQIPQERYLLGGYGDYEWTPGHEVYAEVSFVNNRVATELAATPVTGTFNVNIAAVSPFLSQALIDELNILDQREEAVNAALIANGQAASLPGLGTVSTFIQRRTVETGSRNSLDERNAFRVLAGMRGEVTDTINYDAYYMYARTRNANVQAGNISRSAFQAGLDGTADAINIFGPGTLTDAMVNQISILAQNGDISTLEVATASVNGTFGDFAIGSADPIGFAVGYEYRRQGSEFIPDTALSSGDVIGFNAGQATAGAYNVSEFFGELNIPILGPDSGIEYLGVNGAARYSDYSLGAVGGVWTYAAGLEFAPTADIKFRGQYQRAIRAPNVNALFGGQSIGFPPAVDPCGVAGVTPSSSIGQFCQSNGVPASAIGQGLDIQLGNTQIPALFGGNPNLAEETSDSWTFGVVLTPTFIPGLTITADYFDITIDDAISSLGGGLQNALNVCFQQVQDADAGICSPFFPNGAGSTVRNNQGQITVDNPPLISNANIAELGVSGIDLEIRYGMDLPFSIFTSGGVSDFNINFLGTWTESSYFVPIVGLPDTIECAENFGLTCGNPTPSFKWTSRFSWVDGPVTVSTRWRHLSTVFDDDPTTQFITEKVPAYDLIDLTLSYDIGETVTLTAGVNNLFDTTPELIGDNQEQANTYPSVYDVIGRDFFASVRVRF
ncbi:MAG: TonB-dependent receptor [Erythrobacter sp.]|nr:TonB-dependent receptor [Erythrobacter sp.]